MKKWVVITVLLVCVATFFVCASNRHPSESVIKREFYLQNPNAEIIKINLIFDEVAVATYKIQFKKIFSNEVADLFFNNFYSSSMYKLGLENDYRECYKK